VISEVGSPFHWRALACLSLSQGGGDQSERKRSNATAQVLQCTRSRIFYKTRQWLHRKGFEGAEAC
jgi:hypothetical protein